MSAAPAASSAAVRRVMQGNRRVDTGPELALRRALHALGVRYRVNRRLRTTGGWVRPDISIERWRLAVFVDGCFWHGCAEHGTQPRANAPWWQEKIERNQRRDERDTEALLTAGWTVLRVWEHEPPAQAALRISSVLTARRHQPR
jgi:DNA mismatch endonuclease (patch repair protein)